MLLGIMLTAEAAAASTAAGKPVRDSAAPAVGEAVTVYTEGEAGYAGFRIPVIIRTVDGTLIAFAEARRHDKRDSGDIDLVMRRSEDDGHTWGPITTVWDDGSNTCGNPAPAILSDGRIVMLATWNRGCDRERQIENHTSVDTRRVFVLRSEDHGRTWSHPEEITSEVKAPEWTWYATGPCHAIVKRRTPHKGRIVVPANHKRLGNDGRVESYSQLLFSDDEGLTWQLGAVSQRGGNESTVAELADGSLLLNMRHYERGDSLRLYAVSRDGGTSWCCQGEHPELVDRDARGVC